MNDISGYVITFLLTFVMTTVIWISLLGGSFYGKNEVALKLTNVTNSTMLDLVTHGVIEKEKVHEIEAYFHKHIKEEFPYMKVSHGVETEPRKLDNSIAEYMEQRINEESKRL